MYVRILATMVDPLQLATMVDPVCQVDPCVHVVGLVEQNVLTVDRCVLVVGLVELNALLPRPQITLYVLKITSGEMQGTTVSTETCICAHGKDKPTHP